LRDRIIIFSWIVLFSFSSEAQELEPRALTNLPVGMNFTALGYAYADGNILMDPALPLEDFNGKINTIIMAYARSINVFGKSGKIDIILPFAGGDWIGTFEGDSFEDSSTGFGDLRVRTSINLTGAPALKPNEFNTYKQITVSGLSVQLIIPTGSYKAEQLPNIGSNRWTLRTTYGISRTINKWIIEAYTGVWLFSKNNNFLNNKTLAQTPLLVFKAHFTHTFNNGMWIAFDSGYGYGSQTTIDGVKRDAIISGIRLGLTFSVPINQYHSLRFSGISGIRFKQGGDFDAFGVSYQYKWLKKKLEKRI
jgi:hypothetical protein